ncbi:MAG: nucleotidyltransferase family protein [Anaerolineales bacterium]
MVTAGGVPEPGDSLYEFTQGKSKALLEIAGKPMAQWVLDAISGSKSVARVVVAGVDADSGLTCAKPVTFIPNQGGMLDNIRGAARTLADQNPKGEHVLIVSSDIPTITSEMVDWAAEQVRPQDDMVYSLIERSVMEKRFPNSQRTYTKLKGIHVCGGDMNPAAMHTILSETGIWEKLAAARKNPLKQASLIGFDLLFLMLLRALTLEEAAKRASKNLGLRARAILCPYAEIGMDVDKLHHLDVVRRDLEARASV